MKKIQQQLENYNVTSSEISDSFLAVVICNVLDPSSEFWSKSTSHESPDAVPWNIRKDIVQANLIVSRCTEEICMLQGEMQSVIAYWEKRKDIIVKCLEHCYYDPTSNKSREYVTGLASCLKLSLLESELALTKAKSAFAVMTSSAVTRIPSANYDSDHDSTSSDSDSELEADIDEYDLI